MKKILFVALATLAILFCACTKPFPHPVDAQLLETNPCVIPDLEMEVKIPIGFQVISQAYTDSIAAIRTQENPFEMRLTRIFADTLLNANLSVSDMRHVPYEKTENDLDFYQTTYNADGFWDSVTLNRYSAPDYPKMVVLEMQNNRGTLVRVLFYNQQKAQFCLDYYFATPFYDSFMPFVWSSVASVKPNHELQITLQ